jgi:hypothetical protein
VLSDVQHISQVPNQKSIITYTSENDSIYQEVMVRFVSKGTIRFIITTKNKFTRKAYTKQGVAMCKTDSYPEIDEDEMGIAYPAQEYVCRKNCLLYIRIDLEKFDKLRLIDAGCGGKQTTWCPFNSVGILRRKV